MEYFLKNWPEIIKAAATSTLGILALMVLVLAALALAFFRNAPVKVKVWIFVMLFLGVLGFGSTVVHRSAASEKNGQTEAEVPKSHSTRKENGDEPAKPKADANDYVISEEARRNLEWIFGDDGAAATYQAARNAGQNRYQAALTAQSGKRKI